MIINTLNNERVVERKVEPFFDDSSRDVQLDGGRRDAHHAHSLSIDRNGHWLDHPGAVGDDFVHNLQDLCDPHVARGQGRVVDDSQVVGEQVGEAV